MSRRLSQALSPRPRPGPAPIAVVSLPGPLVLDLVAALVQGGAAPAPALRSIAAALERAGDDRASELLALAARVGLPSGVGPPAVSGAGAGAGDRAVTAVEEALWLAGRAGLPPTALIQRSAEQERRRAQAAALRAVRRLEVLLVVPAGLCLLPAFVLLGIVPVVLDLILGST